MGCYLPSSLFWLRLTSKLRIGESPVALRIYIVEDNAVIRDNLAATLIELTGAVVCGSTDGEISANKWLGEHPNDWDLLIVDIFLKQGNGLGVITSNRNRTTDQKLIVLTNYASPEIRAQCLKLGADQVFDKSHDIENLVAFCLAQSASAH
jgi:DNA-binding response OmpR family regulator